MKQTADLTTAKRTTLISYLKTVK